MEELRRNILQPDRYDYLSESDSRLYDEYKAKSDDQIAAATICRLLEEKAASSKAEHAASRY